MERGRWCRGKVKGRALPWCLKNCTLGIKEKKKCVLDAPLHASQAWSTFWQFRAQYRLPWNKNEGGSEKRKPKLVCPPADRSETCHSLLFYGPFKIKYHKKGVKHVSSSEMIAVLLVARKASKQQLKASLEERAAPRGCSDPVTQV